MIKFIASNKRFSIFNLLALGGYVGVYTFLNTPSLPGLLRCVGFLLIQIIVMGFLGAHEKFLGDANSKAQWGSFLGHLPQARKIVKNQETMVDVSSLVIGDVVKVLPGEIVPCDGVILSGATSIEASQITREDTTQLMMKGDLVCAGTLNRDGTISVQVEKTEADFFTSQVKARYGEALDKIKSKESLGWKRWLFLFLFFIPWVGFEIAWFSLDQAVLFTSSLLVLGSFIFLSSYRQKMRAKAVAELFSKGIIVSHPSKIKTLGEVDTLFFDKTGTLTRGEFHFSNVFLEKGVNQGSFLSMIFSLEASSSHPIAQGVKTHPWYFEIQRYSVKDFKSHHGLGICGEVYEKGGANRFVVVGNQRFLKRFQFYISRSMREKIEELEAMGETVVLCGWDKQAKGIMSFSDTLKEDARDLFGALHKLKISSVMITGDQDNMITNLTYAKGLDQVYTRCLPEEKIKKIKNRQDAGEVVGMVGYVLDGNNVFAQADVSVVVHFPLAQSLKNATQDFIILGKSLLKLSTMVGFVRMLRTLERRRSLGLTFLGLGCVVSQFLHWGDPIIYLAILSLFQFDFFRRVNKATHTFQK
ncbi:MAG: hypothetical protein A2048_02545 [Deltaproteobacteria bacterium GWA2_45_12]|nr:MAG: hypothetical protein A2048_02545 [Deltaproteobacteria bacterium GWA2_45_12]